MSRMTILCLAMALSIPSVIRSQAPTPHAHVRDSELGTRYSEPRAGKADRGASAEARAASPESRLLRQAPQSAVNVDSGTFTMALTGDSIITRRLSVYQEPEFVKMIELIRGADVAFTNLEMLFHDYEPYAMNESGGTYMRADPALAKELVWAGFDVVSRANNHTGDYGVEGMRLTTKHVAAAGLVQAGVGESLPEAREPKFLETAKARVALISVASTFPDHSRAGKSRGDMPARPGLNPLRFTTTYTTTADGLEKLRTALAAAGLAGGRGGGGRSGAPPSPAAIPPSSTGSGQAPSTSSGQAGSASQVPQSLNVLGTRVIAGDTPGVRTDPNKEDVDEIAAAVRSAARLADYTIVTIHAHEGDRNRLVPAQFLVTFARAMVDAGADVFVGHGPHVLRAVEIYKGKPILYSLGDFIFQNDTLLRLPSENYEQYDLGADAHVADFNDRRYAGGQRGFQADPLVWEAVIAVPRFKGTELVELALHPISLGFKRRPTDRGRPMFAEPDLGKKIVDDLIRLSEPFGTRIQYRNGVGYVELPAKTSLN
jgi:poly-gamma-glutamate capsule biosynthesis protein CapA/YwtB (metallophosphatase superfamily)